MIFTIFKKELKDTLRDRRTIMTMIVIPTLIFPVIMTFFMKVSEHFKDNVAKKEIVIGVISSPETDYLVNDLEQIPAAFGKRSTLKFKDTASLMKAIRADKVQLGISFPTDFKVKQSALQTNHLKIYFNAVEVGMQDRAAIYMKFLEEKELSARFEALKLNPQEVKPLAFDYINIASDKETIGKLVGGFLPYLFIVFGFVGCMYPTIDLFTGEKERGTLETLLTTPVSRLQILVGKMGVVVLSGLAAVSFTLVGMYLTLKVFNVVTEPKIVEIINQILTLPFLGTLYLLLIPLIVFFAGVMIPIAVFAKTFKEAQSIITPLNMFFMLPAMIGFFPGIQLTTITACIPVVNIVLATKDLVAGTLDFQLLAISFIVMLTLALLSIVFSYKRFDKETNLVA